MQLCAIEIWWNSFKFSEVPLENNWIVQILMIFSFQTFSFNFLKFKLFSFNSEISYDF